MWYINYGCEDNTKPFVNIDFWKFFRNRVQYFVDVVWFLLNKNDVFKVIHQTMMPFSIFRINILPLVHHSFFVLAVLKLFCCYQERFDYFGYKTKNDWCTNGKIFIRKIENSIISCMTNFFKFWVNFRCWYLNLWIYFWLG